MKIPLSSQTVGTSNMKMKKTCWHKVTKKIAESCGYLIFLSTFAKKLKDRELTNRFCKKCKPLKEMSNVQQER